MPRTDRHAWRWAALALSIAACATLLFVAWNLHHIPSSVTSDFAVFETAHNSSSDGIPGAYDTFVQRHPDWTIKYGADGDVSIGVSVSRVRYTALSVMFAAFAAFVAVDSVIALFPRRRRRTQEVPPHVTYRGVGLSPFTPNQNIVRRERSPRVPTVQHREYDMFELFGGPTRS